MKLLPLISLSLRDRARLLAALRDSDASARYKFRIDFGFDAGRVLLCGTGSQVAFTGCDPYDLERQEAYAAALAVTAYRELITLHGSRALDMIENQVLTHGPSGEVMHPNWVSALIQEYIGISRENLAGHE